MVEQNLTERQKRERDYYEEYSTRTPPGDVCFNPVVGDECRPWNSYWFVIELAKQYFTSREQKLLDFGCGPGSYSLFYSKIGYEVFAFDLSPGNISVAKDLAEKNGLADRTHFSIGVAEALAYDAESFDVVIGIDILHHVEINQAIAECSRVLKRGGIAIFHEPVRVPVFDKLRETRIGRWIIPNSPSYARHITQDERKLTDKDIERIKSIGSNISVQRFLLTSRLDKFIRAPDESGPSILERLDNYLLRSIPFLNTYGGIIVLKLNKR